MNKDSMQEYIFAAQRGDRQALVELLTYSWGIVSYQCKKLLPSRQSAEKMTTVVLKTVAEKLPSLTDPAKFYGWVGHLTAVRCMRVRATLLENGQGDVLIAWENEALATLQSYPGQYELVNPSVSILAQPNIRMEYIKTEARGINTITESIVTTIPRVR